MQLHGHDIGVCSWSLRPADEADLVRKVRQLGLNHVQLGLARLVAVDDAGRAAGLKAVRESGVAVTATMISFEGEDYSTIAAIRRSGGYVPTDAWDRRRADTAAAADLSRELGVLKLSTHIGFVPISSDPNYAVMVQRVGEVSALLAERGLSLVMETGQETASELLQFLNDLRCRNVGINFDPANMILYGAGDPIDAIRTLGRHIWHVHVKDAVASDRPGTTWGREVPFGAGQVPVRDFLHALDDVGYRGPLVIEREAGDDRMGDVKFAINSLSNA
jgi:sugar phosphate isomerase/epimerase